jgi:thiosulfate/3-mercaptopyruvate sulfurtransferase
MASLENRHYTDLITSTQLAQIINEENLIIADCRFDLAKPEWGFENYKSRHIPGAIYIHLDNDLAGPVTSETGRHPLPAVDEFLKKLNQWGTASITRRR